MVINYDNADKEYPYKITTKYKTFSGPYTLKDITKILAKYNWYMEKSIISPTAYTWFMLIDQQAAAEAAAAKAAAAKMGYGGGRRRKTRRARTKKNKLNKRKTRR